MRGPKVVWALCLIGALVFFLFSLSWVALFLLVILISVPMLLLFVSRLTAHRLSMSLKLPSTGEKNTKLTCYLQVSNPSLVPHTPLLSRIRCENLLTGDLLTSEALFSVGARSKGEVAFELEDHFCGTLSVSLEHIKAYDPFGLWAWRFNHIPSGVVCVLPQTFAPRIALQQNLSHNIEADEYAQERPGTDPSDTFAIREYRPGDSLNRMHWKLTWKFDEMMIREPGLPVQHSFLVLLETTLRPGEESPTPQVLDAKMEIAVSLCQALVDEDISFELAWFDHDEQTLIHKHISDASELSGLLSKLMSARTKPHECTTMTLLAEKTDAASYEHILYLSSFLHADFYHLATGARATAIICSDNHEFSCTNEGTITTYYCTPSNYKHELAYLEI